MQKSARLALNSFFFLNARICSWSRSEDSSLRKCLNVALFALKAVSGYYKVLPAIPQGDPAESIHWMLFIGCIHWIASRKLYRITRLISVLYGWHRLAKSKESARHTRQTLEATVGWSFWRSRSESKKVDYSYKWCVLPVHVRRFRMWLLANTISAKQRRYRWRVEWKRFGSNFRARNLQAEDISRP